MIFREIPSALKSLGNCYFYVPLCEKVRGAYIQTVRGGNIGTDTMRGSMMRAWEINMVISNLRDRGVTLPAIL